MKHGFVAVNEDNLCKEAVCRTILKIEMEGK